MTSFVKVLQERFPNSWMVSASDSGEINVSDQNVERGKGYRVEIHETFQFYKAKIEFEDFAKELCNYVEKQLKSEDQPIHLIFEERKNIKLSKFKVVIEDALNQSKSISDGWWLVFEYKKVHEQIKDQSAFADILLSVLLFLLPYDIEAEEEGAVTDTLTSRYERSRLNRSLCLAYYGYRCKACGLDLEEQYGTVARQFIHVHHLSPISVTGVIKINPVNDLVPLCPNCHGIAHLRNPPYPIDEIKSMIINNNGKLFA